MKRQAGFTIIELLIVVTILAMLAGILVPVLEDSAKSARDARRAADLKTVQAAVEAFKRVNGTYPNNAATAAGWVTDQGGTAADYGPTGFIPGLVPSFMQTLPKDPDPQYPTATAHYRYQSDGTDYKFSVFNTPESFPAGNPFYDPANPNTSWMVCSPGAYNW